MTSEPPSSTPVAVSPGERLERDLAEIEYLARVGPSRYGPEETRAKLRAAAASARQRYEAATRAAEQGDRPGAP